MDINILERYRIFAPLSMFIILRFIGVESRVNIIVVSIIVYLLYNRVLSSKDTISYKENIVKTFKTNNIPLYGNIIPSDGSLKQNLSNNVKIYLEEINSYRRYNSPVVNDIIKSLNNMYLVLLRLDNSISYKANLVNLTQTIQNDIIESLRSLELSIPVIDIGKLNSLISKINETTIKDIKNSKNKNKNNIVDSSTGIVYLDKVKPYNLE